MGELTGDSVGFRYVLARHPWNFMFFVIAMVVGLVVASIFTLVWGVLTLIGFLMFVVGILMILLNRGRNVDLLFIICIIVGVFFILLSLAGVTLGTVNLGDLPGLRSFNQLFSGW